MVYSKVVHIRHHKLTEELSSRFLQYQKQCGKTKVEIVNDAMTVLLRSTPDVNNFLMRFGAKMEKVFEDESNN